VTTARYAHLAVDPVRDAMNKACAAIWTAGEVKPVAEVMPIRGVR
jgi:hypothetical protein